MRSRSSSINDAACAAADAAPFVGADAVLETDDRRDANSTIFRSAGDAGDAAGLAGGEAASASRAAAARHSSGKSANTVACSSP